jgi:hypothetical protein
VTIYGPGILTGAAFPFHSPNFTWSLINLDKGLNHSVSDLVMVDPPQFYLRGQVEYVGMTASLCQSLSSLIPSFLSRLRRQYEN